MNILAGILLLIAVAIGFISMANEDFLVYSIVGKILLSTASIVVCFYVGKTVIAIISIIAIICSIIGNIMSVDDCSPVSACLAVGGSIINVIAAILLFIL